MISLKMASKILPALRLLDPERAHNLALGALRMGLIGPDRSAEDPALRVNLAGLRFPNPIGLAAGFDKNAVAIQPLSRLGFGFLEAGTVTPRAQPGNPRPRLFRLTSDQAIINRMGFNNDGVEAYIARLTKLPIISVPFGANIGINKEGSDPENDYPGLVKRLSQYVDYIVINVSSPNTPGLRDLQEEEKLSRILQAIIALVPDHPPLFVKLAPDLADSTLETIVEAAVKCGVHGLIISNTTIRRPSDLTDAASGEKGGLSGAPIFASTTEMLRKASKLAQNRLTLIGCGGVASGADALKKIRSGAHLIQIYTAFTYQGPAVVSRIKKELLDELRTQGFSRVSDAVGVDV